MYRREESSEDSESSSEEGGMPRYKPGKSRFGRICFMARLPKDDADDAHDVCDGRFRKPKKK